MSTTTIRLPDDIKASVTKLAKRSGMTAHGYILEAITEKTKRETLGAEFDALANSRLAAIATSGKTIPWHKLRATLEKRISVIESKRPGSRKAR
jgi:predicted transcriptional regulator